MTSLPSGENRGAVCRSWDEATELLDSVSWGLSSGATPLALRTAVLVVAYLPGRIKPPTGA